MPGKQPFSSLILVALVAVVLPGCEDVVTEPLPDQEVTELGMEPGLMKLTGYDPVTVVHSDGKYEEIAMTIENVQGGIGLIQFELSTLAAVPKFDPQLGELLSARLEVDGWLASEILSHGRNLFYVSSDYTAGFRATAHFNSALAALLEKESVDLITRYEGYHYAWQQEWDPVASIEERRTSTDRYRWAKTYTGTDAQVFLRKGVNDLLAIYSNYPRFLFAGGEQGGVSLDKFLDVKTEPSGAGTKPGIGTLILTVAALTLEMAGHDLYYSDLHAAGAAQFQMRVSYVYQPNRPPDCSEAVASVPELWPPNGRFVSIDILGVTDPDDDPITITVTGIMQDEPTNARGDGNTSPDGRGVGSGTAEIRAERSGTGDGRVYHIAFTADDGRGGECSSAVLVGVPHDRRHPAVDGGPLYDSTQ